MADFKSTRYKAMARALLEDMDVEFYYGEKDFSRPYAPASYTTEEYLELGDDLGYEDLVRNLRILRKMQDLYWEDEPGDRDAATRMYLQRDEDYPDWFWRYHGVYA